MVYPHKDERLKGEALENEILRLIEQDTSIKAIAQLLGYGLTHIYDTLEKMPNGAERQALARLKQADSIEAQIAEIIEEVRNGTMDPKVATTIIDPLKWRARIRNQRVYGEKTILSNDPDNPVNGLAIRLDAALMRNNQQQPAIEAFPESTTFKDTTPAIDSGEDLI